MLKLYGIRRRCSSEKYSFIWDLNLASLTSSALQRNFHIWYPLDTAFSFELKLTWLSPSWGSGVAVGLAAMILSLYWLGGLQFLLSWTWTLVLGVTSGRQFHSHLISFGPGNSWSIVLSEIRLHWSSYQECWAMYNSVLGNGGVVRLNSNSPSPPPARRPPLPSSLLSPISYYLCFPRPIGRAISCFYSRRILFLLLALLCLCCICLLSCVSIAPLWYVMMFT